MAQLPINTRPTPYDDLNAVLVAFVTDMQAILGDAFTGAYLHGSFAIGDADEHSDVDFLVATERDLADAEVATLQAMHGRIYARPEPWAQHLEGSYIARDALRRCEPTSAPPVYVDNGSTTLIRSHHNNDLVMRWTVHERGVTLAGPPPQHLIDPVATDDLRQEVRGVMRDWGAQLRADHQQLNTRWYQPFAVLSYCRMLHTLHTGAIGSKRAGAEWAQQALDPRWAGLIQRAWDERPNPSEKVRQPADPADLASTLEFIGYALDLASTIRQSES
ncbi:MAG: DUF4111 domain-containing protein [Chloroflexales bacterium]|nr:DUF4111 domain-containing protein [Chloroflexales bacterium]